MELNELAKEWRIWVLAVALVTSLILLGPHYVGESGNNAGSVDFTAGDTLVFDNMQVSASGGDAGQANQGGSGGTLTNSAPLMKSETLSSDLTGGQGGERGIIASEGRQGEDGQQVTEASDERVSPVQIFDEGEISPSFTISNDGGADTRGIAYFYVGDGSYETKSVEIDSGSSETVTFDNLEIEKGYHDFQAGFNSETMEGSLAAGEPYFEASIIDHDISEETLETTVEVENLGSETGERQLEVRAEDSMVLDEGISVGPGETETFDAEAQVEDFSDHFNLTADVEDSEDLEYVCKPGVECGRVSVNEIDSTGENPIFNVTVQNTGPLNLDEQLEIEAGGSTATEEVLLAPETAEEFMIELDLEERGRYDYRVSTPHDAETGSFVHGTEPEIVLDITETSRDTARVEFRNPGDAQTSGIGTLRTGESDTHLEHMTLDENETQEQEFSIQAQEQSTSVNVFTQGSADHEVQFDSQQVPNELEGEVCGDLSFDEEVILDSPLEVCGQGATIETNNTLIIGSEAEIDVQREGAGEQSPLEFDAENIRAAGSINTDGPDAGDSITIGTNINRGLDLEGGVRVLLSIGEAEDPVEAPDENMTDVGEDVDQRQLIAEDTRTKLETRLNAYGLDGSTARTVRLDDDWLVQVEAPDVEEQRLIEILEQEGSFEARMPVPVRDTREYQLDNQYTFERTESGVQVDGSEYVQGDRFVLDNTEFVYLEDREDGTAQIEAVAYSGDDVQGVVEGDGEVNRVGESFQFRFPVVLTNEAADNVLQVSRNYEPIPSPQPGDEDTYLGIDGDFAMLGLYVDGQRMSELRMNSVFREQTVTRPTIQGSDPTSEEARDSMNELQSILQSGSLQAPVTIESVSTVSSALGDEFWRASLIALGAALVAVGVLVYIRYGSLKIAVPMFLTGAAEIFIITGSYFTTQGTLGLASIAGIIAAVGTGVDDQIIIADESGREKIRSWRKRMKRAFFVIFTSAASTIGAMAPIISPEVSHIAIALAGLGLIGYSRTRRGGNQYLILGTLAVIIGVIMNGLNPSGFALQTVRGFAETTILGVIIGIAITRPAYAKVLEYLRHKDD